MPLDRPALQDLLDRVRAQQIDIVVVYNVDRLTRSLADFAKLVEQFDEHDVSFVSVTQSFNATSSMGRLTLNVLLSFAQFEREVIGERVRDKIAASKRKGIWVGGPVPLGYRSVGKKLEILPEEADLVCKIFVDYLRLGRSARWRRPSMARASSPYRASSHTTERSRPPAIVSARSRIFSRTASTSAASSIAARSIRESIKCRQETSLPAVSNLRARKGLRNAGLSAACGRVSRFGECLAGM